MALGGEITRGRKRSSRWDWGFGTVVAVDIVLWHPLEVAIHALALIFFSKTTCLLLNSTKNIVGDVIF